MHAGLLNSLIHISVQILSLTSVFLWAMLLMHHSIFLFTSEQTEMNYMLVLHGQQPNTIIQ